MEHISTVSGGYWQEVNMLPQKNEEVLDTWGSMVTENLAWLYDKIRRTNHVLMQTSCLWHGTGGIIGRRNTGATFVLSSLAFNIDISIFEWRDDYSSLCVEALFQQDEAPYHSAVWMEWDGKQIGTKYKQYLGLYSSPERKTFSYPTSKLESGLHNLALMGSNISGDGTIRAWYINVFIGTSW